MFCLVRMILQSDQCSPLCRCAPGYYGSPTQPGGMCRKCNCGGNIDPLVPGSCDSVTGACNICANNTEGEYCERCRPGYFGSARNGDCRRECKFVGTDVIFDWNSEGVKKTQHNHIHQPYQSVECVCVCVCVCVCIFCMCVHLLHKRFILWGISSRAFKDLSTLFVSFFFFLIYIFTAQCTSRWKLSSWYI